MFNSLLLAGSIGLSSLVGGGVVDTVQPEVHKVSIQEFASISLLGVSNWDLDAQKFNGNYDFDTTSNSTNKHTFTLGEAADVNFYLNRDTSLDYKMKISNSSGSYTVSPSSGNRGVLYTWKNAQPGTYTVEIKSSLSMEGSYNLQVAKK
ncbi:hypothetical protein [Cytobacillus sp. IB215665]|uniref:hypothetical protein n=1 Tax=Cytobacillus sp. IB215665 TaxID=3097357 RepID=UPI002A162EB5|nr:hypothetical protein [Cytobacillus sp. IB215665]MDX8366716.1 hypothetical protein [Cytobacillus sp. IB215665]